MMRPSPAKSQSTPLTTTRHPTSMLQSFLNRVFLITGGTAIVLGLVLSFQ
ncbi:MAG: hypothetical protein ABIP94_23625 [Planctomycetota bacterium]